MWLVKNDGQDRQIANATVGAPAPLHQAEVTAELSEAPKDADAGVRWIGNGSNNCDLATVIFVVGLRATDQQVLGGSKELFDTCFCHFFVICLCYVLVKFVHFVCHFFVIGRVICLSLVESCWVICCHCLSHLFVIVWFVCSLHGSSSGQVLFA